MKLQKDYELQEDDILILLKSLQPHVDAEVMKELKTFYLTTLLIQIAQYLERTATADNKVNGAMLGRIALQFTQSFENAFALDPYGFQDHFSNEQAIPALVGTSPFDRAKVENMLRVLAPGKALGLKTSGKQGFTRMSGLAREILFKVHDHGCSYHLYLHRHGVELSPGHLRELREAGALLPSFSRKSTGKWWPFCKRELERKYGKEFQRHKFFARYGENCQFREMDEKEKRRAIRKRILTDFRQAINSLAES